MTDHKTGTRKEWLAARQDLLEAEKRSRGAATNWRGSARSCPGTGSTSSTASRPPRTWASLANLFHGRSQLLVYRWSVTSCSGTAKPQDPDLLGERGWLQRLRRPPRQSQCHAVCRLTGSAGGTASLQAADRLELPLVSSFGSDFNYELHVSHSKEEWEARAVEYLFRKRDLRPSAGEDSSWNAWSESTVGADWETCRREGPGPSAFALEAGFAYHTYSAYERGIDILWDMYQWLDRAPLGATIAACGGAPTTSTTASHAREAGATEGSRTDGSEWKAQHES